MPQFFHARLPTVFRACARCTRSLLATCLLALPPVFLFLERCFKERRSCNGARPRMEDASLAVIAMFFPIPRSIADVSIVFNKKSRHGLNEVQSMRHHHPIYTTDVVRWYIAEKYDPTYPRLSKFVSPLLTTSKCFALVMFLLLLSSVPWL